MSTNQPQEDGDLATLERPADPAPAAEPIAPAVTDIAAEAAVAAAPPVPEFEINAEPETDTVTAGTTDDAVAAAGNESAPETAAQSAITTDSDAAAQPDESEAPASVPEAAAEMETADRDAPPPRSAGMATPARAEAPESRLRTAMRNPKIVLATGAVAALLLSALAAYVVVLLHSAPRGRPPVETHEISAAAPATAQAQADAVLHASAHTDTPAAAQGDVHATQVVPATSAISEHAVDGQAEKAPAGPPLTPQQTMEKQAVEIEALRQSLFQERAARAEMEKKVQLALEAAPPAQEPELILPAPPAPKVRKDDANESLKPQTLQERAARAELEKKNQLAREAADALEPEPLPQAASKGGKDGANETLGQGTLQERAERAEKEKKIQLALEAAPQQPRNGGGKAGTTGRYLEDCQSVGKTLVETLRACAAEFKKK